MSIKLEQCDPKLRERVLRQVAVDDALKAFRKGWKQTQPLPLGADTIAIVGLQQRLRKKPKLRQERTRPLMNKLEQRVKARVELEHPGRKVYAQAIRFRLCNGGWYKPDLAMFPGVNVLKGCYDPLYCYEAKELRGKGASKGVLTVKVAAAQFPEVAFWLVTADGGGLRFERVLP